MKFKSMDLVVVVIVAVLAVILGPAALVDSDPLRAIFGIPTIIFCPGYVLIEAFYPKKWELDTIERVALSFVVSIAIVGLMAIILNYTPWGIGLNSSAGSVAGFVFIGAAIALYRRLRIYPEDERSGLRLPVGFGGPTGQGTVRKILPVVAFLTILASIGVVGYTIANPRLEETFTEFYILGPSGEARDYPQELHLGEQGMVVVGIRNHEGRSVDYVVEVNIDGEKVQELGPVGLADAGVVEKELIFTPVKVGAHQEVEFLLYKNDGGEGHNTLRFWVDVVPAH